MAAPFRNNPKHTPPPSWHPEPETEAAKPKSLPGPHGTEVGWLPDLVYTGEKFEAGLAFFADAVGRITRFSREPKDLAAARRLQGQAALPGLVNVHSISWQRMLRARAESGLKGSGDVAALWRETQQAALKRMTAEDLFEAARMAFTEMLLAGITCVGEFHGIHRQADGSPWPDPNEAARQILRAAHETGIRIALFNAAGLRAGYGQPSSGNVPGRGQVTSAEEFVRTTEMLRTETAAAYASDEAWIGVAPESLATVPLDAFKVIANYAHAQRLRLQTRVAVGREDVEGCAAEYGRSAIAVLTEQGVIDKRFTALHGLRLSEEDMRQLGAARAAVCVCPTTEQRLGLGLAPVEALLASGAGVALGTAGGVQIDLLKEVRALEAARRNAPGPRPALAGEVAKILFTAATVTGARSLGATGGALEVGRPADFFTVGLYDPSVAGADAETLLTSVVMGSERRAVREVWIGARQRIVNGRHPNQGLVVGRFVEAQRRLWA